MSDDLKEFLQNNTSKLDVAESPYAVKSILGSMNITQISLNQQDQYVDAYSSTITLDSNNIENLTFTEPVIKVALSSLNVIKMVFTNIKNPSDSSNSFISCTTDTSISINDLTSVSNEASLLLLNNATGNIENIKITSSSSISSMIQIYDSDQLELKSVLVNDSSSRALSLVLIKDSINIELVNITITNINQLAIQIYGSIINKAEELDLSH